MKIINTLKTVSHAFNSDRKHKAPHTPSWQGDLVLQMAYSIYELNFSLLHCAQPIYCPIYTYAFLRTQKFQHSENLISLNIYQENIDIHHCILNLLQSRNSLVASICIRGVSCGYIFGYVYACARDIGQLYVLFLKIHPPCFLRERFLLVDLEDTNRIGWITREPQRFFHLFSSRIKRSCPHIAASVVIRYRCTFQ